MKLSASEVKARCLALLDRVHDDGEPVTITKRGRVVARLVPAGEADDRPWLPVRRYVIGGNAGRSYDVSPDGQRFLVAAPASGAATPPITVVLNWQTTLKK